MTTRNIKREAVKASLAKRHTAKLGNITNDDVNKIIAERKAKREAYEASKRNRQK